MTPYLIWDCELMGKLRISNQELPNLKTMKVITSDIVARNLKKHDLVYIPSIGKMLLLTDMIVEEETVVLIEGMETERTLHGITTPLLIGYKSHKIDKQEKVLKIHFPFANPILEQILDLVPPGNYNPETYKRNANRIRGIIQDYMDDNPELT